MKKTWTALLLILLWGCQSGDSDGDDPVDPVDPDPPVDLQGRLSEQDFAYRGAFRLPGLFAWGALGSCFYAPGDGGRGSLLITGQSTKRSEFAEISIPQAQIDSDWERLPLASLLHGLRDFDGELVDEQLGEHAEFASPSGIEYIPARGSQGSAKLYGSVDCWYCVGDESYAALFMSESDGSNPCGLFHVGPRSLPFHGNKVGDYLFRLPRWYADRYLGGRDLVTGKCRGTEFGSMGPTLFACKPWETDQPSGDLDALIMLYYRYNFDCASPNVSNKSLCDYPGFTMCDKWEGGAFVETDQRAAILLFGRKGLGVNHYGEPRDGDCSLYKGYHCDPYERQVIFYDVEELAEAAAGRRDFWTTVPYHIWRPSEFYNRDADGHSCSELGGVAYDPTGKRLYVIEKSLPSYNADDQAVVHVWQVN